MCVLWVSAQAPGSLDVSFNSTGKLFETHWVVAEQETEGRIALQSDGKIVSLTNFYDSVSSYRYTAIARYEANGALDTGFGNSGLLVMDTIGPFGIFAIGRAIALQSDGKILVTGTARYSGNDTCMFVSRLLPDGSIDTTFGIDGHQFATVTYTNMDGGKEEHAYNLALQSDGKILISGVSARDPWSGTPDTFHYFVIRLETDGTFDNTWNANGRLITPIVTLKPDWDARRCPIQVQQDGKIVIGTSESHPDPQGPYDFAHITIARFMSDGTIDSTFGGDGIVQTIPTSTVDYFCTDLQLQTDGKIVICAGTLNDSYVARYETNGSMDNTFGTNGASIPIFGNGSEFARSLKIKNDGKIIIGGYGYAGGGSYFVSVLNPDGTKDLSFGTNGIVRTDVGPFNDFGDDLLLQPDEKILVAGHSYADVSFAMSMARYHPASLYNGVEESANIQNAVIYPNPCRNAVEIDYSLSTHDELSIYLESVMGTKVYDILLPTKTYQGGYHQVFEIPSYLQTGFYYLVIEQQNGGKHSSPLFIER